MGSLSPEAAKKPARRSGGKITRRHSTGSSPAGQSESSSHVHNRPLELRSAVDMDAADIAAALAEARRLLNEGTISEDELSKIEIVESLAAATAESFDRKVRTWLALDEQSQTPLACLEIVQDMMAKKEALLAFDFLHENAEPRGWLRRRPFIMSAANRKTEEEKAGGAFSADDSLFQLRKCHARALFEVGSLEAAKGLLLEIHAEGMSDLSMLSLLGRTLKELAMQSQNRGNMDVAKGEMILTQKIFLEAFRRAKVEASVTLEPHISNIETGGSPPSKPPRDNSRSSFVLQRPKSLRSPNRDRSAQRSVERRSSRDGGGETNDRRRSWEARFHAELAARIHEDWRRNRGALADGRFVQRIKTIDGVEHDIANLDFVDLPEVMQASNLRAARDAGSAIDAAIAAGIPLDRKFIESASKLQHIQWMEFDLNLTGGDPARGFNAEQHVPYEFLTEEEKNKDRNVVYMGIRAQYDLRLRRVDQLSQHENVYKRVVEEDHAWVPRMHVRRQIAHSLHEVWREQRARGDGTFTPRIKVVEGVEYDIANLTFDELPPEFQDSNLTAAHCACSSVERGYIDGADVDGVLFREAASRTQHVQWMDENRSWADPSLLCDYDALSEEEKEKDRRIVDIALKAYREYAFALFQQIPAVDRPATFAGFSQELATFGNAMRVRGDLASSVDLLEIDQDALLKVREEWRRAEEAAARAQSNDGPVRGFRRLILNVFVGLRSTPRPRDTTGAGILLHPTDESVTAISKSNEDSVCAAVTIGVELAHTARISSNTELAIDVSNEVILLCSLLPRNLLDKNATLQISLGEAFLHLGEIKYAFECYTRAKAILVSDSKWKVLHKTKMQGLHIYMLVSQAAMKDQLCEAMENPRFAHNEANKFSRRFESSEAEECDDWPSSSRGGHRRMKSAEEYEDSFEDTQDGDLEVVAESFACSTEQIKRMRKKLENLFNSEVPVVGVFVGDSFGHDNTAGNGRKLKTSRKDEYTNARLETRVTRRISNIIAEMRIGVGFSMGLPGADIVFLETVLSNGGDVFVVLPCPRAEFEAAFLRAEPTVTKTTRSGSLETNTPRNRWAKINKFVHNKDGMRWKARMHSIFNRAKCIYEVGLEGALHNPSAMEYCFRVMAGLAIEHAKSIGASLETLGLIIPDHMQGIGNLQKSSSYDRFADATRKGGPLPPTPTRQRTTPTLSPQTNISSTVPPHVMNLLYALWQQWRWDPFIVDLGEESDDDNLESPTPEPHTVDSPYRPDSDPRREQKKTKLKAKFKKAMKKSDGSFEDALNGLFAGKNTIPTSPESRPALGIMIPPPLTLDALHELGSQEVSPLPSPLRSADRRIDSPNKPLFSPLRWHNPKFPTRLQSPEGVSPLPSPLAPLGAPPSPFPIPLPSPGPSPGPSAEHFVRSTSAEMIRNPEINLNLDLVAPPPMVGGDPAPTTTPTTTPTKRQRRLRRLSAGKAKIADLLREARVRDGTSSVTEKLDRELVQGKRQDVVGIMFADAVGFSKLREVHMYAFIKTFLGRVGELVEEIPVESELRPIVMNTWGDGIFMAFRTARAAVRRLVSLLFLSFVAA